MDTGAAIGSSAMEFGDWRAQLQRQRSVHNIMDILKMHLPFSRHERLQVLEKIAVRVEEEVYSAATSQSEYSRKICFIMLSIETRLQNYMSAGSNSAALYNRVNPSVLLAATDNQNSGSWQEEVYQKIKVMKDMYILDLAAQTSNRNGQDWQEEVHQKIKAMKDLYLPDLNDMHRRILSKLQQHNYHPQQPENEQIQKLKRFERILESFMHFLQIPKHGILAIHKDKLSIYEKQIINVINSYRRKPKPPQQQAQALPPTPRQSIQEYERTYFQLRLVQSHENQNGQDWQEEVYQKIKPMKDLYLPDLNEIHEKALSKLQQHESLPQQPRNEQLEKLKVFIPMLERFMQFLQIPKHGILISYKDKLGTYERQIIHIINSYRRKQKSPQQQAHALPSQHMQSMHQSEGTHSQLTTQVQSHENRMNLQGPMTPMQPNNTVYLQQNAADSVSGGSNAQRT